MPLFNVAVREHAYTGRFYSDVVQAESYEEALQVAAEQAATRPPSPGPRPQQGFDVAVPERTYTGQPDTDVVQAERREEVRQPAAQQAAMPQPPPGPRPQRGFSVVVRAQAYAGRFYSDVVQAESCEEALQVAAEQAATPQPPPRPKPQPDAADRPRCGDVWIHTLLHCELAAGHDGPHMAVARGYGRPVSWVRDDRGLAHALPDPVTGTPNASSITWTRDAGIAAGGEVIVELAPEGPQRADLAEDIAAALAASPAAAAFFDTLAQYDRKGYLRWIDATTRRPDVRAARIAEVVDLLAAGIEQRR